MSIHGGRNWKAIESTDFSGNDRKLTVTGEVEVGTANQNPVLAEAIPQGINKMILILVLSTIEEGDVGADVLTWKTVKFEKPIDEGEYSQVDVRDQALVDVEQVIS